MLALLFVGVILPYSQANLILDVVLLLLFLGLETLRLFYGQCDTMLFSVLYVQEVAVELFPSEDLNHLHSEALTLKQGCVKLNNITIASFYVRWSWDMN